MTPPPQDSTGAAAFRAELRTPRSAGIAGIVFALTLTLVAVLLHAAVPDGNEQSVWITDSSRRGQVTLALELVPYSGIAFLWFIGVIRARLGDREDKLFSTVFLGSGLLFVAMLFTSAALMGAALVLYNGAADSVSADNVRLISAVSTALLATFGIRMAAVFTLVVTNLGRRTAIVPRWLQVIGYLSAVVLLLAPPRSFVATLLFPVWVLLLSTQIMIVSFRPGGARPIAGSSSGV